MDVYWINDKTGEYSNQPPNAAIVVQPPQQDHVVVDDEERACLSIRYEVIADLS